MQPVTFDGCFGWLHKSNGSVQSEVGIVICTGLRRDAANAHRPFRILADTLAAAGYPVLRFDYFGTGDSCDVEAGDYWSIWQNNVMAAADQVRAASGAQRVVLVGLRIGAALATLAATRRLDVAGLLLLDPVVRGKSYLIQLSVEARLRNHGLADEQNGLRVDELYLTDESVRQITQMDLRDVLPPQGCSVAMFCQDQANIVVACRKIWAAKGVPVECGDFSGLEMLLRPAHLADEPVSTFAPVLEWMGATHPNRREDYSAAGTAPPRTVTLQPNGCVETPVRFGNDNRLFGMLCHPDEYVDSDMAVIIGNPGGDPHHGYARYSVELARRLAAQGIASLRIDFAGLGDSIGLRASDGRGEAPTSVFEVDRNADFSSACDALEALGYRRFVSEGVCSGAYHAFRAGLADPRIVALLLINLPWFTLRHESPSPGSFASRSMAELARRQVACFLMFSAGDAGIRVLETHFGPAGVDLCESPDVQVAIVSGMDHDLTSNAMRRDAADRMISFLQQAPSLRYPKPIDR